MALYHTVRIYLIRYLIKEVSEIPESWKGEKRTREQPCGFASAFAATEGHHRVMPLRLVDNPEHKHRQGRYDRIHGQLNMNSDNNRLHWHTIPWR
jgi:hypothetical protein